MLGPSVTMVAVVHVGKMPVRVADRLVAMHVAMGLTAIPIEIMLMLMV